MGDIKDCSVAEARMVNETADVYLGCGSFCLGRQSVSLGRQSVSLERGGFCLGRRSLFTWGRVNPLNAVPRQLAQKPRRLGILTIAVHITSRDVADESFFARSRQADIGQTSLFFQVFRVF